MWDIAQSRWRMYTPVQGEAESRRPFLPGVNECAADMVAHPVAEVVQGLTQQFAAIYEPRQRQKQTSARGPR